MKERTDQQRQMAIKPMARPKAIGCPLARTTIRANFLKANQQPFQFWPAMVFNFVLCTGPGRMTP